MACVLEGEVWHLYGVLRGGLPLLCRCLQASAVAELSLLAASRHIPHRLPLASLPRAPSLGRAEPGRPGLLSPGTAGAPSAAFTRFALWPCSFTARGRELSVSAWRALCCSGTVTSAL